MEFFIRKKSTLPVFEINLLKDGRLDYNYGKTNLSGSTISLSLIDEDNEVYKITNGVCNYSSDSNTINYQFTKKNTSKVGRYLCEIKIINDQGTIILPLKDKIYVSVLDSFVDSEFCCGFT